MGHRTVLDAISEDHVCGEATAVRGCILVHSISSVSHERSSAKVNGDQDR